MTLDAERPARRPANSRREHQPRRDTNGGGRNGSHGNGSREVPYDSVTERDVLARALSVGTLRTTTEAVERVATAPADLFYVPAHRTIAATIATLYNAGVRAPSRAQVVETIGATDNATPEHWHGFIGKLYDGNAHYVAFADVITVEALFDVLERFRRRRLMLAQALDLIDVAERDVDWHDTARGIYDLANTNGAVTSPSTLETINLDSIVAGDAPPKEPFWLRRDDGTALLYPGCIHDFHAEPSIGKTWIALAAVIEVLNAGGSVVYLDYEDTAYTAVSRLMALGVDPELLTHEAKRFRYINPAGPLQGAELAELERVQEELCPDLIIVDAVAEALARDGYDEDRNAEVTAWADRVIRPMARRGAAVLLIDHVTKSTENRSRGARGAGAKLALIDGVSYDVRIAISFSVKRAGMVKLIVAKDRHGQVGAIGEHVANVRLEPDGEGNGGIDVVVETPPDPGDFRPTGLMEKISRRLEAADHAVAASWLFQSLHAKKATLQEALSLLLIDGHVKEIDVGGGSKLYRSESIYREKTAEPLVEKPSPSPDTNGQDRTFTDAELFGDEPQEDSDE